MKIIKTIVELAIIVIDFLMNKKIIKKDVQEENKENSTRDKAE